MAQLPTHQDVTINLNIQAEKESSQHDHSNSAGTSEVQSSGGRIC